MDKLLSDLRSLDEQINSVLNADDFGDEQQTEHDKLVASRAKLTARIKLQQEQDARSQERLTFEADAATRTREQERQSRRLANGRLTDPDLASPSGPVIEVKDPNFLKDPKKGFRTPREFLLTVMHAGASGHLDERLRPLNMPGDTGQRQLTAGSDEARGSSDPYGGFLVPEGFIPDLLTRKPEDDPMAGRITEVPMARPIVRIPARTDTNHTTSVAGGLTVTRRPETIGGTSSQIQMERVTLEAFSLFGLSYASEELLTDSPISFIAILEQGFREQFTYQLINERLNGNGAGEYLGVLNSPALVTVTKETGQATKTLILENIVKMRAQCYGYSKAIWIVNHDVGPQLSLLNQAVGVAGTGMIWQPSAREGYPDMLLGRPIYFSEYAQTLGTAGDVYLVNWSEYLHGSYQPIESAESIHVRFVNHERAFKFWLRDSGVPWWRVALTPKFSSSLLSPYVVLGSR